MKLHELNISIKKRKKRIGRGGKRGTYSGRGQKGQKSRAGRRIRPAVRDLISRIPKRRGVKHKPLRDKPFIVHLRVLDQRVKQFHGNTNEPLVVHRAFLRQIGLLPVRFQGPIKVLGKEAVSARLVFIHEEIQLSKGAREQIEKAGGRVITEYRTQNTTHRA